MKTPGWLNFYNSWSFVRFIVDGFVLMPRSSIRFIEVILFIAFCVVFGRFLGEHMHQICGIVNLWIYQMLGVLVVPILIWLFILGRILLFFPFPRCKRGKCHSIDNYGWHLGTFYGRESFGVYHYGCRCGDEYIRKGRKIMIVLPDGTKLPFKKLIGFWKWADDLDVQDNSMKR